MMSPLMQENIVAGPTHSLGHCERDTGSSLITREEKRRHPHREKGAIKSIKASYRRKKVRQKRDGNGLPTPICEEVTPNKTVRENEAAGHNDHSRGGGGGVGEKGKNLPRK